MFTVSKEIIWHLTCVSCHGWFTFATMEEKYCIEGTEFHCPHCGKKSKALEGVTKIEIAEAKNEL